MQDVQSITTELTTMGLSAYEAKAYVALVAAGEALSGYEVAKRSGVPRSTVYETLAKLLARGAAFEVRTDGDATAYVALPPQTLLRRLRHDFDANLQRLDAAFSRVSAPTTSHLVHTLEGREAVLARAADVIHDAEATLHVSAWSDDLDTLRGALEDARARGIEVTTIHFGGSETEPVGHSYPHLYSPPEEVMARVGCRLLVVAQDHESVLIGGSVGESPSGSMWGLFSDDPAVVLVAEEFIRHDIGFQVLTARVGPEQVAELFRSDPELLRLQRGGEAPALARRRAAG